MKISKHPLLIGLTLILSAPQLSAQIDLAGVWGCECVLEYTETSIIFNEFCPYELMGSSVEIGGRDLFITDEFIEIQSDGKPKRLPYVYDRDEETLAFTFNDKELEYKILSVTGGDHVILKDKDGGTLLYWKRK